MFCRITESKGYEQSRIFIDYYDSKLCFVAYVQWHQEARLHVSLFLSLDLMRQAELFLRWTVLCIILTFYEAIYWHKGKV